MLSIVNFPDIGSAGVCEFVTFFLLLMKSEADYRFEVPFVILICYEDCCYKRYTLIFYWAPPETATEDLFCKVFRAG